MDKDLDFEKLMGQAKLLSQLMNGGAGAESGSGAEAKGETPGGAYEGAFASAGEAVPAPDSQEMIEKAMQAAKILQMFNQPGLTPDNVPAYDNVSVHNEPEEWAAPGEKGDGGRPGAGQAAAGADFSRVYDETFTTPSIKAMKSAVRFVDPKYHRAIGLWIKFMEIQNMMGVYERRAAEGDERADWRRGMLLSVRPHVSYEKQCAIDLFVKLMELMEIVSVMGEMGNGS